MTNHKNRTPVQWDNVRPGVKPVERTAKVCLDGRIVAEIETLAREHAVAKRDDENLNRDPVAPGIATQIRELTEQAHDAEVEFVFRAMGRKAWRDLVAGHPPTPEQRKAGADFNPATFPPAAMAACCIDPVGVDFDELAQLVTESQWDQLWIACHTANTGSADVSFFEAAFAQARPTVTNSGQQEPTEFPEASS